MEFKISYWKWLKPRPESGLDRLIFSKSARLRVHGCGGSVFRHHVLALGFGVVVFGFRVQGTGFGA